MKQSDSQRSLHSFASRSDDELEKERLDQLLDDEDLSQGETEEPQHPLQAPLEASVLGICHLHTSHPTCGHCIMGAG